MSEPKLTDEERGILAICRYNKTTGIDRVVRKLKIGRVRIKYERRFKSNLWGRFGGGWNWKVGVQAGGNTVIIDLLVAMLRITLLKPAIDES